MKKNYVVNTTAEARNNPIVPLVEAMALGSSEAIVASEKRGQTQLVHSDLLPADCNADDRKALETAGVIFGKHVGGDTLFVQCTLPAGWKKVATGHDMHSDLVDEHGRKRASIFYKAAFYDRKAHMHAVRRYNIASDYGEEPMSKRCFVKDGDVVLFTTEWITDERGKDGSRDAAKAWLEERFPQWQDAAAYW